MNHDPNPAADRPTTLTFAEQQRQEEINWLLMQPATLTQEVVERCLKTMGLEIAYDEITGRVMIEGKLEAQMDYGTREYSHENALNVLPVVLTDKLKEYGFKVPQAMLQGYLMAIADARRQNRVITEVLGAAVDDDAPEDRIQAIHEILGIQRGTFHSTLLLKWMVQCIQLAFNDEKRPMGADGVLVLQGPQGCGKTRFFSVICGPVYGLFREGLNVDVDKVDSRIQATSCWIAELGELDSTLKRDQAGLKAFLTSATDVYRRPYAAAEVNRARRTSFCATVNQDDFLHDETGNRRFWVVPVERIDVARLNGLSRKWVILLWKQVAAYLEAHPNFRLTDDEQAQLRAQNQRFLKGLPGEQEVRDLLDWQMIECNWAWFKASEVRERIRGYCAANAKQIGKVLKKLSNEDARIQIKVISGSYRYRLPLRRFD